MIDVTKQSLIYCSVCGGKGWVSVYHNDTKDCERCGGNGELAGAVPLTFEELSTALEQKYAGKPFTATSQLEVMETHRLWREAINRR